MERRVKKQEASGYASVQKIVTEAQAKYNQPLSYVIALRRQQEARQLLSAVVTVKGKSGTGFAEKLSRAMMNPLTGVPILLLVLYFGLYQFVGVLGAGTLVDFIESTVFGEWLNPWVTDLAAGLIPFQWLRDLFVGEYGIITLGLSYAIAIILPIVTTFFIVFSIIEDSGYLPRLAMLIDRVFKVIGRIQGNRTERAGGNTDGTGFRLRYHGDAGHPDPGDETGEDYHHPVARPGHSLLGTTGGYLRHPVR
jgi:ferrous iron transport protein B